MIEDQCSDDGDKKARNKKKLTDAESMSHDPFVRKKMDIQEKIAETREVRLACTVVRACCSAAAARPNSLFVRVSIACGILQHITERGDLLNKGGKGSVETVKNSAKIRKDLKELSEMKADLERVHAAEETKALKKARSVCLVPPIGYWRGCQN